MKKLICLVLTAMMIVTVLPVTVFAATKLKTPSIVLTADDKTGEITFVIDDPNPDGVDFYEVKLYKGSTVSSGKYVATVNVNSLNGSFSADDGVEYDSAYIATVTAIGTGSYSDSSAATSNVVVAKKATTGITLKVSPKIDYKSGENLDLKDLVITVKYTDNSKVDKTAADLDGIEIDGKKVSATEKLNSKDHNGKKIKFIYGSFSVESGALIVRDKLKTPTIEASPDYTNGGVSFVINDKDNPAPVIEKYEIEVYSGAEKIKTETAESKTGTIPADDKIKVGMILTLKVSAIADPNKKTTDGAYYYNSDQSAASNSAIVVKKLTSVTISKDPTKVEYRIGDKFEIAGMQVTLKYSDDTSDVLATSQFAKYNIKVTPENGEVLFPSEYNNKKVIVKVGSKTAQSTSKLTINGDLSTPVITITSDYEKGGLKYEIADSDSRYIKEYTIRVYKEDDTIAKTVEHVTALSGSISLESLEAGKLYKVDVESIPKDDSGFPSGKKSEKTAPVMAGFKATSIAISSQPARTTYNSGDEISYSGLIVKVVYGTGKSDFVLVDYSDFEEYGLTVTPEEGAKITKSTVVSIKLGSLSVSFDITVAALTVSEVSIVSNPTKTTYQAGQKLSLSGLKVRILYTNGTYEDVTYSLSRFAEKGITVIPSIDTPLTAADKKVIVTCGGKSATFDITVNGDFGEITKLAVTQKPATLTYIAGQKVDLSGLIISLTFSDGTVKTGVKPEDFETYGITYSPDADAILKTTDKKIRISASLQVYADVAITVTDDEITEISVNTLPTKKTYISGDKPDYTGLKVNVVYGKSTPKTTIVVDYKDFEAYGLTISPDKDTELTPVVTDVIVCVGSFDITNSENNIATAFKITVKTRTIKSVEIIRQPTLTYKNGDSLDLSSLIVKLTYDNGSYDYIGCGEFEYYGVEATPADGTKLTDEYDGVKVTIKAGKVSAETNEISIVNKSVSSITITTAPKLSYDIGDKLDLSDMVVTLKYSDGSENTGITFDKLESYGIKTNYENGVVLGEEDAGKRIILSCTEEDGTKVSVSTAAIQVTLRTVVKIEITSYKDTYYKGERFDTSSMTVTALYGNGQSAPITASSLSMDPKGILSDSTKSVTFYYSSTVYATVPVYVYDRDVYDQIATWENPFTDIKKEHWFYQYAAYMNAIGGIEGMTATTFGPTVEVTRAMFVEMLWNIEGRPIVSNTAIVNDPATSKLKKVAIKDVVFTDVPTDSKYYDAIRWAYVNGITTGTGADDTETGRRVTFGPDTTINREMIVTLLYRFARDYKKIDVDSSESLESYPDYKTVSSWAVDAMKWATAEDIINGRSDAGVITLSPAYTTMRCEAAKILTVFHIKYVAE